MKKSINFRKIWLWVGGSILIALAVSDFIHGDWSCAICSLMWLAVLVIDQLIIIFHEKQNEILYDCIGELEKIIEEYEEDIKTLEKSIDL